ncbi:MAG: ABC transporter ATP-binding protein [Chlorobiales bacterium]|nr:ABC transporter ATP-binding protein [Chlorobiales bacterium]
MSEIITAMHNIFRLSLFVKPYLKQSSASLLLLTAVVGMDLSIPRLIQRIIDQGIHHHNQQVVLDTGLLMLGITLLSVFFAVSSHILSVRVGECVARDIREALFLKIQSFSFGNIDRMNTGQLMVRLSSDISAVQRVAQFSLRIGTRSFLLLIGSLILMIRTSIGLSLAMLPLLIITALLIVFFVIKMEPLWCAVQQQLDRLNTVLQENIAGIRLIKAFVRADFEFLRFNKANQAFTRDSISVMKFMASMPPILTMCINTGIVLVIWVGGLSTIRDELTIGQVVAFTNYLLTTMAPMIFMANLTNVWAAGIVSSKRVVEVLDIIPDIQNDAVAKEMFEHTPGGIVFENVSFRYSNAGGGMLLDNISFTVEPGKTLAILGATGAGKSTLVNLIPRFYDLSSGRILIDGVDIRAVTQDSLLRRISIVPQETILFSGTILDNIRYGVPTASHEDVIEAAKVAQAHDFILNLQHGYDTRVEERGVNLSGGQKQRIAIARAMLASRQILIFDDSTSAVDIDTETRIQDALAAKYSNCTLLIVAQRISSVLKADKIIVLDKGRIVGEGRHAQLMKSCNVYREIYDSQLGCDTSQDKVSTVLESGVLR